MKGLDISRSYYFEYGEPMLEREFPEILPVIAAGLCGSGSECFGYDDVISTDHDFDPGFCIFIPGEEVIDRRTAFLLERAYASLPREYMGFRRPPLDPAGGNRRGVIRYSDFFLQRTGDPDGRLSVSGFLRVPDHYLAEAVNGEIFRDDCGVFSDIRARLADCPRDARLKKLAGALFTMGQAGQYNYPRCLARGEYAAARLSLFRFAEGAIHAAFLVSRRYMPYYKWAPRALRELDFADGFSEAIETLLTSGCPAGSENNTDLIESVCRTVIDRAAAAGDCDPVSDGGAERAAYSVNDRISDPNIRNTSVAFTE